jgi:hypothetical protein
LKRGREDSDEREAALEELKAVEQHHKKLKEELAAYADSDPAALEAMNDAIEVAHAAANRWTDNIFTLQQWCSTTFPQAKEQLEHMYREVGSVLLPIHFLSYNIIHRFNNTYPNDKILACFFQ